MMWNEKNELEFIVNKKKTALFKNILPLFVMLICHLVVSKKK